MKSLTMQNADDYFRGRFVPAWTNFARFHEIVDEVARSGKRLNQHLPEFRSYLEYAAGYFMTRGVSRPLAVEIGILDGAQKRFYEALLGAEYIGIDVNPKSPADIVGGSATPAVYRRLLDMLDGRAIDILFIDGLHTYEGAKADYEIYRPLVRHIIGIHDILTPRLNERDPVDVIRLWDEIKATNKDDTLITIQHHNPRRPEEFNGRPLGIGLVVKDGRL